MSDNQKTIGASILFTGKGLHTGVNVNLKVLPAVENSGIKFCRVDLAGSPTVDALADNVVETSRSTVIEKHGAKVSTVEHIMAALWGMGVDNALIEVDGPEVPIADGSAATWVQHIAEVGVVEQNAARDYYLIDSKIEYKNAERKSEITAYPDNQYTLSVHVDFASKVVGKQYATFEVGDDFGQKIAPCRTFVFLHEILPLVQGGLIKGGDLANAIVVVENPLPAEEAKRVVETFNCDPIQAQKSGYLTNGGLRYENEIACHKMLDLMGDLALIGKRIKGHISATRPGHSVNTEFAKIVRKAIKTSADKPAFKYDPNAVPVYDVNKIKTILPHRPPFLLVDKIIHIDSVKIVGIKQVTMNEPFFMGHFPDEPVMPGVLQIEAMAQCGGILALSTVSDPECYSTYFLSIDGVKFKRKVVPGDTMMFVLQLSDVIRRGIVNMSAKAYVGDTLVCEANLKAMISKNR